MKSKYKTIAIVLGVITGMIIQGSLMYLGWSAFSAAKETEVEITLNKYSIALSVSSIIAGIVSFLAVVVYFTNLYIIKNRDADQIQRRETSELELFEQRVFRRVDNLIKNASIDSLLSDDVYKKIITEKFGDDLLTSVDQALSQRVTQESKTIRVLSRLIEVTDELKIRLEGPAGRAERQAFWAKVLAYVMAISGIGIALYRLYLVGDLNTSLLALYETTKGQSIWPFIIALSAPWVGLIFLIEFTALLFARFSNQASTQQRYFTEAYTELKDRHAALSTIIEYGTPEQIITSARAMIVYGQRQMAESNDAETISASSNLVQSLTGLIKETVSKAGTK